MLIRRVAESPEESERFREEYENALVADFTVSRYGNQRRLALNWLYRDETYRNCRLVYNEFRGLGITELDTFCRKHGGYELLRAPDTTEMQYLDILSRIARDVFSGFTCYQKLPNIRIIMNRPPNNGSANRRDTTVKEKNRFGMTVRSEICSIQLRSELLQKKCFAEAVVVFMHELLHQFGGDGSSQFRHAITAMSIQMIQESERLEKYQKEWEQINNHKEDDGNA